MKGAINTTKTKPPINATTKLLNPQSIILVLLIAGGIASQAQPATDTPPPGDSSESA
jgi:hypothetical protein